MRAKRSNLLTAIAAAGLLGSAAAPAAAAVSGTVTRLEGGALAGATVTVAGPGQPPVTQATGADGRFSLTVAGSGPFSVGVQATGMASQSVGGLADGADVPLALAPSTFRPLPVDGGSVWRTAADASSGVFYALMNFAPEVYRTIDHGGTWQPVPLAYESPATGLPRPPGTNDAMTTSGVPGEVAVLSRSGGAWFSTDFGLTWRAIGGDVLPATVAPTPVILHWGHAAAGAPSVLVASEVEGGHWTLMRADMSAASPTFVKEPADPFGIGAAFDVADSATGSFVGRVSASGELSFAPLTASGPLAFGPVEASGLPTPPVLLRAGGREDEAAPPDALLAIGGERPSFAARILTKEAGAAGFSAAIASATTALPAGCQYGQNIFEAPDTGSIAPTSGGGTGAGNASQCWLRTSGTGDLAITNAFLGKELFYDAGWGVGNHVALTGEQKLARVDADGVPQREPGAYPIASAGTGEGTGGYSVTGLASVIVADTAYGPAGASELSVGAGNMQLASNDGGTTMWLVAGHEFGATATEWWEGASGDWLVYAGSQSRDAQVAALRGWEPPFRLPDGGPNVAGSSATDLGGPDARSGYGPVSLESVPGTDTIFIGAGTGSDPVIDDNDLVRARIQPGDPPALVDRFNLEGALGSTRLYLPQAMAYCPPTAAYENMRDVLFVATGDSTGLVGPGASLGALLRITGATTNAPAVSVVDSVPHDVPGATYSDVRAACDAGVVYTGGMGAPLIRCSRDGGLTFEAVPISTPPGAPMVAPVIAIGLNPADAGDVTAAGFGGAIAHSADGGDTWTLVNDPTTQRPVDVVDIEFPAGGTSPRAVGATAPTALVGTAAGVFAVDVGVRSGIIAAGTSGASAWGSQITQVASDAQPVLAEAVGAAFGVFRRANGLAVTVRSSGSWAAPATIPGTLPGDTRPVMAAGPAGELVIAFRRPAGAAPGIYVVRRAPAGTWSVPQRVSRRAGDVPASLVVTAKSAAVAFVRADGVRVARSTGGPWRAAKLRGTRAARSPAALAADASGRLRLVFPGARGIFFAALHGKRWSTPRRLTRGRDSQPAFAIDATGARRVVFRRAGKGLFTIHGARRWAVARLRGTSAADRDPALATAGTVVVVAYARPSGIRSSVAAAGKRAFAAPRRLSNGSADRRPAPLAGTDGNASVLFERR